MKEPDNLNFNEQERELLFSIVRKSIRMLLDCKKRFIPDETIIPDKLRISMGAFVTLKINGSLRGCIGRFISDDPLYMAVKESAISAAFEDPRFDPVSAKEYDDLVMEITVLGPLRKIRDISEIIIGKHGIYIKKDFRSGTMLPQVASENNWSVEEFLGYTSREKAGLGWDGWKNADIFIYDGLVLKENIS
jgi:MEMO1 family protein